MKYLILLFISIFAQAEPVKIREVYMDRDLIHSIFLENFGPSAQQTLEENILWRPEVWGGPCDSYRSVYYLKGKKVVSENPAAVCPRGDFHSKIEFHLERGVIASAVLAETCRKLVNSESSFSYFKNRNGLKDMSKDSILKIYTSFFKSAYPTKELTEKLSTGKNLEEVTLAVCQSPSWQRL